MTTDALNSPPVGPGSVGPVSVAQCWVRCLTLAMSPSTLWEEPLPGKGNLGIHLVSVPPIFSLLREILKILRCGFRDRVWLPQPS